MTTLSIIVPVYKDKEPLKGLLKQLKKLKDVEVLVSCVKEEYKDIKKISKTAKVVKSEKGRANQMNKAAKAAKGKFLWFLHADSDIEKINIEKLNSFLKSQKKDIRMSFKTKFLTDIKYFRFVEFTSYFSQKHMQISYGDQGQLYSKKLFESVDGFGENEPFEDMSLSRKLKKMGYKNIVWEEPLYTSPRRAIEHGVFYTHTIMSLIFLFEVLGNRKLSVKLYKKVSAMS